MIVMSRDSLSYECLRLFWLHMNRDDLSPPFAHPDVGLRWSADSIGPDHQVYLLAVLK